MPTWVRMRRLLEPSSFLHNTGVLCVAKPIKTWKHFAALNVQKTQEFKNFIAYTDNLLKLNLELQLSVVYLHVTL